MQTSRGMSGSATALPEGLAAMPPGPELAAALASVDRTKLDIDGLLDLVAARARLLWHLEAQLLADLHQAVCAEIAAATADGDGQRPDADQVLANVATIVGWQLRWSAGYAQHQVDLAVTMARRLPMVLARLGDGRIDPARAGAFADLLAPLDESTARAIATRLLDKAERWTVAELRERLRYHVDRADPTAARRRYRTRVTQRDVWLSANPDGTANLSGHRLPPHRAAAAFDRLDRLARAARADGDARTLNQLRADAMVDLLAGVPFQLHPGTDPISTEADRDARSDAPGAEQSQRPNPGLKPGKSAARPQPATGVSTVDRHATPGRSIDAIDLYDYDRACLTDLDRAWAAQLPPLPDPTSTEGAASGAHDEAHDEADDEALYTDAVLCTDVLPGDRCACGGLVTLQPGTGGAVHVQIRMTTLLGLDQHPAIIEGFGPTLADIARQIAVDPVARPIWRWSLFTDDGELLHHGHTRARRTCAPGVPRSTPARPGSRPGSQRVCRCPRFEAGVQRGSVEIQLTPAMLARLLANPVPGYEALIADIANQVHQQTRQPAPAGTGRMPDAAEQAFIRARDRSCRTPTCRVPARRTEIDHRVEHAKGGPSHRHNCDCRCKRHHRLRERGFGVHKHGPTTVWTTRTGRRYEVVDKDLVLASEP